MLYMEQRPWNIVPRLKTVYRTVTKRCKSLYIEEKSNIAQWTAAKLFTMNSKKKKKRGRKNKDFHRAIMLTPPYYTKCVAFVLCSEHHCMYVSVQLQVFTHHSCIYSDTQKYIFFQVDVIVLLTADILTH